jgi:hypothetical protein
MTPIEAAIAKVQLLDDDKIACLAWKFLDGEDARSLTFDRSPEFFPQVSYSVPTVQLTNFANAVARACCEELLRGKVLVPVEPTQAMLDAGDAEAAARGLPSIALITWQAMIAAHPEANK